MPPTTDPSPEEMARTRGAILNVLIGIAAMIALSGWLIRARSQGPAPRPIEGLPDLFLLGLFATALASHMIRRRWTQWATSVSRHGPAPDFFRSHVASAAVAALGVPIGLGYGWFVNPSLDGITPFWIVPMALGILAIPRRSERRRAGRR